MEDRLVGKLATRAVRGAPVSSMGEDLYFWISESFYVRVSEEDLLSDGVSLAYIVDTSFGDGLELMIDENVKKELINVVNSE